MNVFVYMSSEACETETMTAADFRTARSRQKHAAILRTALDLFREHGVAGTSMDTLARQAGVSTATLYRHFRSKEALFEAVTEASLARLEAALPGGAQDPEARLRALARAYAELLCEAETRGYTRLLISEAGRNPTLADVFYTAMKLRLSDIFAEAVTRGVKEKVFKPGKSAAFQAAQLQGMIEHSTLMRGLICGDEVAPILPARTIADEALETWLSRWSAYG